MGFDLVPIIQQIQPFVTATIPSIVGGIMTALFLRGNTGATEFKKIQLGKFDEALDDLLQSGKLSYLELYKCKNFLKIAEKADAYLKEQEPLFDEPKQEFDFDWFMRFFEGAGNISNEEAQELWARVLAGTVRSPGSFSFRAMELLHNLTPSEAHLLKKSVNYITYDSDGMIGFFCDNIIAVKNSELGLTINEFTELAESGLITPAVLNTKVQTDFYLYDQFFALYLKVIEPDGDGLDYVQYILTKSGRELFSILDKKTENNYLLKIGKYMKEKYAGVVEVYLYKMEEFGEDSFTVDDTIDLLSIKKDY